MTQHNVIEKFNEIKEKLKALVICTSELNQAYIAQSYVDEKWNAVFNVLDAENNRRYLEICKILKIGVEY